LYKEDIKQIVFSVFVISFSLFMTRLIWAGPTPEITDVYPSLLEGPIHHGIVIETKGISDPGLTAYEVHVKPDTGNDLFPPWSVYSTGIQPYDGRTIVIPYRNGVFALAAEQPYCVRIRGIYAETPTPWVKRCGLILLVTDASTSDEDEDGLSDQQEFVIGTDPRDADSDRDGRDDGTEIAEGRDPHHPDTPDLIVRTPEIDFGEGDPFGRRQNQHQFIVIENVGDEKGRIEQVSVISGTPSEAAGFFQIGSYPTQITNIPPQSTVRIPVSFLPTRRGDFEAMVEILSDDPEPLEKITLRGVGVGIPDCLVTPSLLDFGTVGVEDQEVAVQYVTLANQPPLGDISPPNVDTPWGFTLSTTHLGMAPGIRGLILQKGEEMKIPVLFQHPFAGDYNGYLEISSATCGVQRVELRGRAIGLLPRIQWSLPNLSFGADDKVKSLTITNDGDGALYLKRETSTKSEYFGGLPADILIPSHDSRTLTISFIGDESVTTREEVVYSHNDPDREPLTIVLEKGDFGVVPPWGSDLIDRFHQFWRRLKRELP
jgi:hypothetical protein